MTDPAISPPEHHLLAADLIDDRALTANDVDTLDHGPIANRVADLVVVSEKPLNVALFGAWGSGKSSFANLLERALGKKLNPPTLVRYNAWTFEGESFQRNFISSVATSLGMHEKENGEVNSAYVPFHSGLYHTRRSGKLEVSRDDILGIVSLGLLLGIVLLVALLAVAGLLGAVFGSKDPIKDIVSSISGLLPASVLAGLLASIGKEIVSGARVNIDTSAPTQEQFRTKFEDLLALAKKDKQVENIVFFIDELDRCAPEQVVTILAAVRHFYDLPNCAFVVAADREAIEEALKRRPKQATPVNTETPYYSAAGEYIDKIFQHQLTLPPLRGRRLTRFARDLVIKRTEGLWAELAAVGGGTLLNQVIYVLIPSNVRSPRRVKVLLNNFATNARIAQSRGVDVVAQALEVAKLVALRTEFPTFAADLILEPRLPALLLTPPSDEKQTPRLRALLKRHKLPAASDSEQAAGDLTETDATLAKAGEDDGKTMRFTERSMLRRYLVRTSDYPDPKLDLLYLEPAGAAVDLADRDFGLILEEASIERPAEVVAAANDQPVVERLKSLRILADMMSSGNEFGPERANVATALLGVAETLQYEIASVAGEVVGALRALKREEQLEPAHLAPTLAVSLKVKNQALADEVLADPRLLEGPIATRDAALVADLMTQEQRKSVWDKVAEFYPNDPATFYPLAEQLTADVAEELLRHIAKPIRTRLNGLDPAAATAELGGLLALIRGRSGDSEHVRGTLLLRMPDEGGNGYTALRDHQGELDTFSNRRGWANVIALKAIRLGPESDWSVWRRHIKEVPRPWNDEPKRATDTAASILKRWAEAEADGRGDEAVLTLHTVAARVTTASDASFAEAIEPHARALTEVSPVGRPRPIGWWEDDTRAKVQMRLHRALLGLDVGPQTHSTLSELVVTDLERAIASPPTELALTSVQEAVGALELTNAQRLAASLKAASPDASRLGTFALARLAAAKAVKEAGGSPNDAVLSIEPQSIVDLMGTSDRQRLVERWFELGPDTAAATEVARALGAQPKEAERRPIATWARTLSPAERTDLLIELTQLANDTSPWMTSLAQDPVEEERLLRPLLDRLQKSTRNDDRRELARTVVATRPTEVQSIKAVGATIVWLLEPRKGFDRSAALDLVPVMQRGKHGMGKELGAAFDAAEKTGLSLTKKARQELEDAKIPVTKPAFAKGLRSVFGGGKK